MLSINDLLCPICSNFDKLYLFECQHFVCTKCVAKLTNCPICRITLKSWKRFRLVDMNLFTNQHVDTNELYNEYKNKFWYRETLEKLKEYNRNNVIRFLTKYLENGGRKHDTTNLEKIFVNDCEILFLLYLVSGSYNGDNKVFKNILKNGKWINIRAIGRKLYRKGING